MDPSMFNHIGWYHDPRNRMLGMMGMGSTPGGMGMADVIYQAGMRQGQLNAASPVSDDL